MRWQVGVVGIVALGWLGACAVAAARCPEAPVRAAPSSAQTGEPQAPGAASATSDIGRMLDDWHDAADKADLARYFGHLAEDAVFLGTAATERWSKEAFLAYARPHFEAGKAWTFRAVRRAVTLDAGGELAHFDEELETLGLGPARGSGVVAWRGGRWLLLQYNLAITVPNERFDLAKEAAGAARVLAPEPGAVGALGWLSGAWVGALPNGDIVEAHFTNAAGGTLVGVARVVRGESTRSIATLRIELGAGGALVCLLHEGGGPPLVLAAATDPSATDVVFESATPRRRLSFSRDAEALRVADDALSPEPFTLERAVVARARP